MGGGWERIGAYGILVGRPKRKRPLGNPNVNGRLILKRIFKKWHGGGHGLDRDMWRAVVNAVMNVRFP
jgi:hypothetical protein